MQNNFTSLLHPRYWPIWFVLGIVRILVLLPYRWQMKLGRWLGRLLQHIPSRGQRAARVNLKLCFPELNDQQRQELFIKSFESIGIAVFETAMGWWNSKKQLQAIPIKVTGLEHFPPALQRGNGVLVCSPHFTTLELTGRLFAERSPFTVVYRPQKNPLFEFITRRALDKHYTRAIPRQDIRGTLRTLNNNEIVWYAPDVDAGRKNSVFVPFFGVPAATITATSRYAKITGASVMPVFFYRRENGYEIVIREPLQDFPSNDLEKDAARINKIFEQAILVAPEQYLWQYKRFKTRPAGEKKLYQ